MASFTIKNIPDHVYEKLKARAAENHRSINQEAIVCLTLELMRRKRTKAENERLLAKIDAHREKLAEQGVWIPSDEWLNAAIDEGRE
jgi:plasmid stability protein